MSEPVAPYRVPHTPRFRVWDPAAGQMHYPERFGARFVLAQDGTVCEQVDNGPGLGTRLEWRPDLVPLLSTGLRDAEGREVFEGDVLEFVHGSVRGRGVVEWIEGGFWLAGENGQRHMPAEHTRRVVGNIYEPAPAPADA